MPTDAPEPPAPTIDPLFERVAAILEQARGRAVQAVNSEMVLAYWHIGREIVLDVQRGADRAEYGETVLDQLSAALTSRFGRGFSVTNLKYFRQFYLVYAERRPEIRHQVRDEFQLPGPHGPIRHEARDELQSPDGAIAEMQATRHFSPSLSWTHYRLLAGVADPAERLFYEAEAEAGGWSTPVLARQIHTHLFARLRKSRDRPGVLDLATRGQQIERPVDTLRDPYVLDFLDLPDSERLRESDLEAAIIAGLQSFLLELGKGFAFVARQKRLQYDDEHFYVDLVFYNCILKCYLLIDLKMGRLAHQDVGQMDSYVRLFDDRYTAEDDNPTIGLILCAEKNEAVARYSVLHENQQLFAARYVTWLPTEDELQREIQRERMLLAVRRAAGE